MPEKILVGYQRYLDGGWKPLHRFIWAPGEMAKLRAETEVARCEACDTVIVGRRIMHQEIYEPFSDIPDTYTYCEPCSDRGEDQGEHFWCEGCERDVWENKGYRVNYKFIGDCTLICVRCFQEEMFEHGHSDEEIESGKIPCDFYDYTELAVKGFEEGESFSGSMLERSNGREWREYCRTLKAEGAIVLTDQGRTSIIGGPDSVTVWFKYPQAEEAVHA